MIAFASSIFISAFLLFQVQPVVARFILPWFGGGPSVWTACMLFFQVGLLLGYGYAHVLARRLPLKRQAVVHLSALVASLFLLPITPSLELLSIGGIDPTLAILQLLAVEIGIPFVLISATAPLLQHWFANLHAGQSPFRLYALSNFGSLVALLGYPVVVEPNLTLFNQTIGWSVGYAAFCLLCLWCAWPILRGTARATVIAGSHTAEVGWRDRLMWVLLAGCGSTVLLAVTNQMCQDVAVVPFLWVLPLALYLTSFIICFDREAWYVRRIWVPFLLLSVGLVVYLLRSDYAPGEMLLGYQIAIYSAAGFGCFMVCHGELARRKPAVSELTTFYIYVALGGALGGVFVGLVAPLVFNGYWELHIALLATFVLTAWCIWSDRERIPSGFPRKAFGAACVVSTGVLVVFLAGHVREQRANSLLDVRNFYGVLHVYEFDVDGANHERSLFSGRIPHGSQSIKRGAEASTAPTAYYGWRSGIGVSIRQHPKRLHKHPDGLKIGAVGLGVGTITVHLRPRDRIRYYELNPQVLDIANGYFTFLQQSKNVEVSIGDARVTLQRELEEQGSQQFDLLAVDAFSGDSIPMHLLTEEAMDLYWRHLADDGVLALHLTNIHLDLFDVVRNLAQHAGKQAFLIVDRGAKAWEMKSDWVIITSNRALIGRADFARAVSRWPTKQPEPIYWTDNFSNLYDVVIWN